ncbi:helix-turn-helix transcriptional regulator [Ensifer aridi]|uniref:helix-turn-helix transcriptional regulator n=1 Tax=Ensifer aridi TaxID=1708715 RepID=UPI000A1143B5|nr:helix-turn-helix domain-containing protein [Ensifer aridi]
MQDYFTTSEFARLVGCSRGTVYNLWKSGNGPEYIERRIGGQTERLVAFADALDWLKEHAAHRYVGYLELMNLLDLPDEFLRVDQ